MTVTTTDQLRLQESKVFELVILERCRSMLDTSPHQFGSKAKHRTELSIFALKQVIEYYITNSSNVYICYIDLSKAYVPIQQNPPAGYR